MPLIPGGKPEILSIGHWLYLSSSPRSRMSFPPLDLDLGALDLKRLKRLAIAMCLDENLTIWRDRTVGQTA